MAEAFMEGERHQAEGQRLHYRVKDLFPDRQVERELFELMRRTSLVRQGLPILEDAYLDRAFNADRDWVDAQIRRVISVAARASGRDLERAEVPFLIGFRPSFVGEKDEDTDGQPPSTRIMEEHAWAEVRTQWEAAGHKWDEDKHGPKRNTSRKKFPLTKGVPTRDSEPDISDGKPRSDFPIEEQHVLWLAGYDGRPALVFKDGCSAQLSVRVVTRMVNPRKVLESFQKHRHPIDLISPLVSDKAITFLRKISSKSLEEDTDKLNEELRLSLMGNFEDHGFDLVLLSIHVHLG